MENIKKKLLEKIACIKYDIERTYADDRLSLKTKAFNLEHMLGYLFGYLGSLRLVDIDTFCEEFKKIDKYIKMCCNCVGEFEDLIGGKI